MTSIMTNLTKTLQLRGWRVLRERRSAAALEFAIISPVIILMGLVAVELSAAIRAQMQVDQVAHAVANLISDEPAGTAITPLQLKDIYQAGLDMYTYTNIGTLTISAGSVNYTNQDSLGQALATPTVAVGWDAGNAGVGYTPFSATPAGSAAGEIVTTLSDGIDNDSAIIVLASATFKVPFLPAFYGKLPTAFSFSTMAPARPRFNTTIAKTGF